MRNFDGFLCVEDADRLPPFKSETPKSRENSRFWAGSDYTLHPKDFIFEKNSQTAQLTGRKEEMEDTGRTAEGTYARRGRYIIDHNAAGGPRLYKYEGELEKIDVPDYITAICPSAFEKAVCRLIFVPDSVSFVGSYAFAGCEAEKIRLPDELTELGSRVFLDCPNLKSIALPTALRSVPYRAFRNCRALEQVLFPKGLRDIQQGAFEGCSALRELSFGKELKAIGQWAFSGCSQLKSVSLPDSVEKVDEYAFDGCQELEEFYAPDSVQWVYATAFSDCPKLRTLRCNSIIFPKDCIGIRRTASISVYLLLLSDFAYCSPKQKENMIKGFGDKTEQELLERIMNEKRAECLKNYLSLGVTDGKKAMELLETEKDVQMRTVLLEHINSLGLREDEPEL